MNMQDRLRALIEPIVTDLALELFDLEYSGATLTVTVERRAVPGRPRREQPTGAGGVGIDDITAVTRAVSRALDEADPIAGAYRLEVSSPGLERSLRVPAHFTWAVGQTISVKTVPGFEAGRRFKGELTRADDAPDGSFDVRLDEPGSRLAPSGDATVTIRYDQVDKARTVFEWGPEPKPTKPPKPARPTKPTDAAKPAKAAKPGAPTKTSQKDAKVAADEKDPKAAKDPKAPNASKAGEAMTAPPAPDLPAGRASAAKTSPSASSSPTTPPATNSTQASTTNSKKVTAS